MPHDLPRLASYPLPILKHTWGPISLWLLKLHNPRPVAKGRRLKVPLSPLFCTPVVLPSASLAGKKRDLPPWQWQFLVRRKGLTRYWWGTTWEVGRVWKHLSNSIERMLTVRQALDIKDKKTRQVVFECFVFLLINWTRWHSILGALTKPWIKCGQKYYALISKVCIQNQSSFIHSENNWGEKQKNWTSN